MEHGRGRSYAYTEHMHGMESHGREARPRETDMCRDSRESLN